MKNTNAKAKTVKTTKTKEQYISEIQSEMVNDFGYFYQSIFGKVTEDNITPELLKAVEKIKQLVSSCENHNVLDYDLYVYVNYRIGKMRNPKSYMEEQPPKKMKVVLDEGFDIPVDVSLIELRVMPAMMDKGKMRIVDDVIFETKMAIGKEENLTVEQLMRRYGITPNEKLLSVEDLQNNRILRFYEHNVNTEC
ncbi:MAG: hypothetical protein IJ415_00395 [Clostridia bacterium]|nr:hypothetical protein [Clostridia bacterium]